MSANNKGKKCYTNGEKNIYLSNTDPIPNGFYKGFTYKSKESLAARVAKTAQTKQSRYGTATYNNSEKSKNTCLAKYGVDNPAKSDFIQEKIRKTNLERYGTENVFQADAIKEKIKQTTLEHYGVENISQSVCKRQLMHDFWSTISNDRLSEIARKKQATCIAKYGVANPAQYSIVQDKISTTCQEKYGVPYFCMSDKCRSASSNNSSPNLFFEDLFHKANLSFDREYIIGRKSYDFKLNNILIEINPAATHNSTWGIFGGDAKDKYYHFDKSKLALDNGFRCIHVWDWDDPNKVLKLLTPVDTVYARNCMVQEISVVDSTAFINEYHLQGAVKSTVQLALIYNNSIISVMTFGKPRYNKRYQYELLRYCSAANVIGGAEKLFSYFIKHYNPDSIISYCDLSKFTGRIYEKLGFTYKDYTIGKHWYNPKTKRHITDNLLRQRGFDQLLGKEYGCFGKGTSNEQLMRDHDFVEIYDCGQATFVWNKIV